MSGVLGEYARAQGALGRPTLRLLNTKWAAFRVAALRTSFSRSRRSLQADAQAKKRPRVRRAHRELARHRPGRDREER